MKLETDVVVVGSGPGGAAVSRELARRGRRVVLLERGIDHRGKFYYGTYLGALRYSQRAALLFTREGQNIIAPLMLGGATSMYCGCAAEPPDWLKSRYGVDIDAEVRETVAELGIRPLPEHLRGAASTHIARAGRALGYEWFAQPKFMDPARSRARTGFMTPSNARGSRQGRNYRPLAMQTPDKGCSACEPSGALPAGVIRGSETSSKEREFNCRATCMLGCRCGAKWNAAEWVDEAVCHGARLVPGAMVRRVKIENGRAVGVEGRAGGRRLMVSADTVVLCGGGIGSPRVLQASGLSAAGVGMAMDTTTMVYGFAREPGTGHEPPMTWSWENPADGYMLSTLTDPFLLYPTAAIRKGFGPALGWLRWNHLLGIMIKLKDEISGGIYPDGAIRKPLTARDSERLKAAEAVCRRILVEAGAKRSGIFMRPLIGTHPSATVRIGEMLDANLKTEIDGLYVCDASVFPEALDRPTVLTILGLGKRLARHLVNDREGGLQ
jgi:choline dehydrogenase-like flavoprotein